MAERSRNYASFVRSRAARRVNWYFYNIMYAIVPVAPLNVCTG